MSYQLHYKSCQEPELLSWAFQTRLEKTVSDHKITDNWLTRLDRLPLSNKTKWLLYMNFLFKLTTEKSIFNVQPIKGPISDICYFSHERESITIIKSKYLNIPFGNQASLKTINLAIRTNFDCINPTTNNDRYTWSKRNKLPVPLSSPQPLLLVTTITAINLFYQSPSSS